MPSSWLCSQRTRQHSQEGSVAQSAGGAEPSVLGAGCTTEAVIPTIEDVVEGSSVLDRRRSAAEEEEKIVRCGGAAFARALSGHLRSEKNVIAGIVLQRIAAALEVTSSQGIACEWH